MTAVAIDPSTTSLGWCLYRDGLPVTDGFIEPSKHSPSDCLLSVDTLLDELAENYGEGEELDAVAIEKGWNKSFQFNPYMLVLSLMPEQVKAWAENHGVQYAAYAASTIKSEFGITKSVTGGKRANAKKMIFDQVSHLLTEESRALPKSHRFDVADAHAVMWVAQRRKFKSVTRRR